MKVIKINKSYRSGTKEHFLVLLDEPYSNDDIDYLVEEWCESEPSGMSYGYTLMNGGLLKILNLLTPFLKTR